MDDALIREKGTPKTDRKELFTKLEVFLISQTGDYCTGVLETGANQTKCTPAGPWLAELLATDNRRSRERQIEGTSF
jgi:hypothetical protein